MDFLQVSQVFVVVAVFLQDNYDKLTLLFLPFFSTFLPLIFRSSPLQWIGFLCSRFGATEDFLPSK